MAAHAICNRAYRRGARQRQSRLSAGRARIRAEQGRLQAVDRRGALQDVRVRGDDRGNRAGARDDARGRRAVRRARAEFAHGRDDERCGARGHAELRGRARARAGGARFRAARRDRRDARLPRSDQHPVHERHDGQPEGRDAHAPQRRQQRALDRERDAADRGRCDVHSGAALSLLRDGAVGARVRIGGREDGVSRRGVRAGCDARGGVRRALHRAARRADDVHRRARSSGFRPFRPEHAAHRHHGGFAVPDRDDEARGREDAHVRGDDRLRDDGDEPRVVPERDDGFAREAHDDGRPDPAASGGEDRRRDGRDRARRRDGRAVHARLFGDARLLGRRGQNARGGGRWLDAHGRPRDARRRRLLQHRRAPEGHADSRRRERVPARDRGVSVPASEDPERAGVRRARFEVRRGSMRVDRAARGRDDDGRRAARVLQRPDRALQGAALRALRRRTADDRDGEGAEVRDARTNDRRTWFERAADGLTRRARFQWTKKSGLMSPLKTTRYGVSARRPKVERIGMGRRRLQQGCPWEGIRYETDGLVIRACVRSHAAHETASVLKP
ncbi:hypothetical protein BURPS1710b_0174 [Burkholderia pseudomallei 1710b]|uniref:Uncharacterized protein n=6 Tax=pseudomallei group TaxID=111527 RepID=Q3JXW3_BURP1|nr:hypothetical protein BURPS1710b_0174 [Burkholderia pseudomallei 1710b]